MTTPVIPPVELPPVPAAMPTTITPPVVTTPENLSPSLSPALEAPSSEVVPPVEPIVPTAPVTPPAQEPQGYEIELAENSPLTEAEVQAVVAYAEKYQLSKEDAQAIIESQEASYTRAQAEVNSHYTAQTEQRRTQLNSHPDFSGDKAAESWESVNIAVQAFGTPELVAALKDPNKHGYDLSVALMLKNIGDQLKPETVPAGKSVALPAFKQAENEADAKARRLYPDLFINEK